MTGRFDKPVNPFTRLREMSQCPLMRAALGLEVEALVKSQEFKQAELMATARAELAHEATSVVLVDGSSAPQLHRGFVSADGEREVIFISVGRSWSPNA